MYGLFVVLLTQEVVMKHLIISAAILAGLLAAELLLGALGIKSFPEEAETE
jgi:hypothetical protein